MTNPTTPLRPCLAIGLSLLLAILVTACGDDDTAPIDANNPYVGQQLGGVEVVAVQSIDYLSTHTYDILPESDGGAYFAGGALIGSTLWYDSCL